MTGKNVPRTIILVSANLKSIQKVYRNTPESRTFSWLYLSKDALLFIKLRTVLPQDITIVDTGDVLQDIAHKNRQDYIDFIGSLSVRNNSLSWWLTSVSEKNPFVSTVFLYFCYLKLAEQWMSKPANLVIICDSPALINAIQDTFVLRSDLTFRVAENRINRIIGSGSGIFSGLAKKGFFALRLISRIGIAKCYAMIKGRRNSENKQKKIAIHSWTDARSFSPDGKYRDAYFGEMRASITQYCPDFFTLSYVLPTLFYPKAVLNLSRCKETIFLFEEFLSMGDVFRSLFSIQVNIPSPVDIPLLKGIDLSSVIRQELHADRYESSRSETALLHYYAGRRIFQKGDLKTLVYTFENHMWEKMLCRGIRESGSGIMMVGYAHSIVSTMYMFYSLSSLEQKISPLPDLIMVNGKITRDRLISSGFSAINIVISGAIRYEYLTKKTKNRPREQKRKTILVTPTAGFNETLELLDKVIRAFKKTDALRVIIKLHPALPLSKIFPYLPELPDNFSFSQDSITTLLDTVNLLLYTETAVSVEALSKHIPILHIKSDLRIDMNLFDGIGMIRSVSRPEEICRQSLDLLNNANNPGDKYDELVHDFFSPENKEIIRDIFAYPDLIEKTIP